MRSLFFIIAICCQFSLYGAPSDTLYINRGTFLTIDSTQFNYLAFNVTPQFQQYNEVLKMNVGDTLCLTVINTDTVGHHFTYSVGTSTSLLPADTASICLSFSASGVYHYFDDSNFPLYAYLGLAGIIHVVDNTLPTFYWNMRDHQAMWNQTAELMLPDWTTFSPDYFTVNGRSNPATIADSTARIVGNVGDTLQVVLCNSGLGIRSIHFHGYHALIVHSTRFPHHVGRIKDTFSVMPMESVMLELIPHQAGEYPVHEHNLVGVSANNMYPNGMFSTILIQP